MNDNVPTTEVPVALLANVANLIDMVTERGAFKGPELTGISQLREFCVQTVEQFNAETQSAPVAAGADDTGEVPASPKPKKAKKSKS